jgi:hypothetical protein
MSPKFWELARRAHHNVEIALWATLFAFGIFFTVFVLPKLPEIRAQNAIVRVQEINAENALLCEKLGIKRGADTYNQCLLDVGEFRLKAEKRAYDETAPW